MSDISKVHLIQKDTIEYLRFEYVDSTSGDFEIFEKNNQNHQRAIKKEEQKYYLIEDKDQIDRKFHSNVTDTFEANIFLVKADFSNKSFKQSNFSNAIFVKDAIFSDASFESNIDFDSAIFLQSVDFSYSTVLHDICFSKIKNLESTIFNFKSMECKGALIFDEIPSLIINTRSAIIARIAYGNTKFESDNRETFLTLKNAALKQNDQIRALEFHQKEYETHFKALQSNKSSLNLSDRVILRFEKNVSRFGTSIFWPLLWFFLSTFLFYAVITNFDFEVKSFINFISPVGHDIDVIFQSSLIQWWDRGLFLFYKILQLVIIYEIIKSFRKFSQTL